MRQIERFTGANLEPRGIDKGRCPAAPVVEQPLDQLRLVGRQVERAETGALEKIEPDARTLLLVGRRTAHRDVGRDQRERAAAGEPEALDRTNAEIDRRARHVGYQRRHHRLLDERIRREPHRLVRSAQRLVGVVAGPGRVVGKVGRCVKCRIDQRHVAATPVEHQISGVADVAASRDVEFGRRGDMDRS